MSLPNVAYFSMEIAMDQSLKTYSGGLGFLAGSHMLSAGYLQMPMVGVTMLWSYGYYGQRIAHDGQVEVAYIRKYYDFLKDIGVSTEVDIFGEKVKVKAYLVEPDLFGTCPVYLLTTDIEGNSDWAKSISHKLYDGNERIRIAQETVLGIAGVRVLQAVGYNFDVVQYSQLTLPFLPEMKFTGLTHLWKADFLRELQEIRQFNWVVKTSLLQLPL